MWNTAVQLLERGHTQRVRVRRDDAPVSYREVLRAWRDDEPFRTFFLRTLADAPFAAFRWETPPVSSRDVDRPFEFVLLDEPGLPDDADPRAFSGQFAAAREGESVVAFTNLGKDATLIVPRPAGPNTAYGHLAAFVRRAPDAQKHDLWRVVGQEMERRLGDSPVWLSTAGMGVAWLHVRLDSRPKYYGFREFAEGMRRTS